MSALGLGRVKTASKGIGPEARNRACLRNRNRSHQRLGPDDVHHSCQVIGENRESHLGGYFWKRFGEEVCRSHTGLHRAERMLDRLATLAHGERVRIKALPHGIEQVLMLPSWDPPLWPCRALGLERTILTGVGPVTPY